MAHGEATDASQSLRAATSLRQFTNGVCNGQTCVCVYECACVRACDRACSEHFPLRISRISTVSNCDDRVPLSELKCHAVVFCCALASIICECRKCSHVTVTHKSSSSISTHSRASSIAAAAATSAHIIQSDFRLILFRPTALQCVRLCVFKCCVCWSAQKLECPIEPTRKKNTVLLCIEFRV